MERNELLEIGRNLAMTWGAECYKIERNGSKYTFYCIEVGEFFTVVLEENELEQFKEGI